MSVTTGPRLGLLINADIGETYVNELRPFLRAMDALLQASVIDSAISNPPATPQAGDAYLVLNTPTGLWTGQQGSIAVWSDEITLPDTNTKLVGWEFHAPAEGWQVWDKASSTVRVFTKGAWKTASAASIVEVPLNPSSAGAFAIPHGLASTPTAAHIEMTSSGQIWFQPTRYDATYLYLEASGYGVTGYAKVWP